MATGYTPPGATCCCGGDTTNCCPYGDGEAPQICVTFPAGVWPTPLTEAMFGGGVYTLDQAVTNCLWNGTFAVPGTYTDGFGCTYSLSLAIQVNTATIPSATGELFVSALGTATLVSGSGCATPVTVGLSSGAGSVTAAAGCKPQTTASQASGIVQGGFGGPYFYTTPAGILIEDGACGGMMAAPRLMAATAAPPPSCRWQGDDLAGAERAAEGLDHRRRWLRCGKPGFERVGLPVTDCRTCGTPSSRRCLPGHCPGYEPAAD